MAAEEVEFDYDATKALYLAHIKKCFDADSCHSETAIQDTIKTLKSSPTSFLHKNFEVSHSYGNEILLEKRKFPGESLVQVLSFEDVFDIFIKYHTANNHAGGRLHLMKVEQDFHYKYRYPLICLSILVKSCNVCKEKNARMRRTKNTVSAAYVTVMIQYKHIKKFRYLLIYHDKMTNFIVLRPLREKLELEIALELFKILMQFGPPEKLRLYGYNKDFNKRVGGFLRQVCSNKFDLEYKTSIFDPSAYVVNKLHDWMKENGSDIWEIGCFVVQNELNTSKQFCHKLADELLSSRDLLFGTMHSRIGSLRQVGDTLEATSNLQNQEKDDDVVELRIPSPENDCNFDLLSQFDLEVSQKRHLPTNNENKMITIEDEEVIKETVSHIDELDTLEENTENVLSEDMVFVPNENVLSEDTTDPLALNTEV